MSDKTSPPAGDLPETTSAPRVRRISNPRPKKATKVAKKQAPPAIEEMESTPFPSPEPVEAPAVGEWPEPEAESAGGPLAPGEGAKRKRRRRKGKGQGNQNVSGPLGEDAEQSANSQESTARPQPTQQPPQQPQAQPQQRSKVDPELLTKMAWKIYLAEVSEEGVALIGDNDAKDLSRRCFRLAEIFIEEQSRRR